MTDLYVLKTYDEKLASPDRDKSLSEFCLQCASMNPTPAYMELCIYRFDDWWNLKYPLYTFHSNSMKSKKKFIDYCQSIQWSHPVLENLQPHLAQKQRDIDIANEKYCQRIRLEFSELEAKRMLKNHRAE